tara:strand:- start:1346 stop:1672 length:327 start_codon:yes stop_codon:yes gene_type:complete
MTLNYDMLKKFEIKEEDYESCNEVTQQFYELWYMVENNKNNPNKDIVDMIDKTVELYVNEIDFSKGPVEARLIKLHIKEYYRSDCDLCKIENFLIICSLINYTIRKIF